ncbi:MAG: hypothetical protein JEY96_17000 [Bacteroidales bacterium]|nr:hypothetical protein [Bacteroidales bacterium]
MSIIKIYYRKPTDLERVGINAANQAALTASTTAIQFIKTSAYAQRMLTLPEVLTNEEMLSLDGSKSPYKTSAGDVARNVLMLSTIDDSLQIQLIDVGIKASQANTIKQTPLTGRKGTIKEYIQAMDHNVVVKGNLISGTAGAFPFDMLHALVRILKEPAALKVANKYLEAFDISKLVLRTADYDQSAQKYMNVLPFSLNFVSDEDYELQID